jgi:flagellar hook-associated protein 3 FlgL
MIRSTEQTLYRLDNLNAEQQRISYQMSTGKKLQEGSDDASLYTREIYVDDKIRVYEGIKIQIEKTNVQNNTSDSTLKEVKDLLSYIKSEVIKASTATTDDEARLAIAVNLKGVKENLFDLSNEQVEGEYLFSGSNSLIKPFEMDSNGKVTYNGDGHLRKVAVEDGSYRERGINGFETFMYTSNSALKGGTLNFKETDRIIDQDGLEWKLNAAKDTLEKYDSDGNLTSETITPVTNDGGTPPIYSGTMPSVDGTKFEAKTNTFDVIDDIINALEKVDSTGSSITSAEALTVLQEGLGEVTKTFDAANIGHAKLGGRNKVFELSLERVSTKLTQFNILSQEVGAADLSKVAVEAKALELTYTALYSTINKMNELSLVNFIR